MGSFAAVSAAAKSVEMLLNACFNDPDPSLRPIPGVTTKAILVRTEELVKSDTGQLSFSRPALTLYTYRIDFNKSMRAAWAAAGTNDGRAHLPLDLHFLITPWGDDAEAEHRILGKAMECLELNPVLSGPMLYPDNVSNWLPADAVHIVQEDVSTEAMMRTFDTLPTKYKLSVPYIARVVRVDSRRAYPTPQANAVETRLRPGGRE